MQGFKVYGNNIVLLRPRIAIHASVEAPEALYLHAEKLFSSLLDMEITIGSAWHSPLEKQLFDRYSQLSSAYLVYFLSERMADFKMPGNLVMPYENRRAVVVEPSAGKEVLEEDGLHIREEIIDDLFDHHLFLYIRQGGIMEQRFANLLHLGKRVAIMRHTINEPYFIGDVEQIEHYSADKLFA